MQYDLKDIAERIARIRELEAAVYHQAYKGTVAETRSQLAIICVELAVVADLLPKVEK